MELFQNNGCLSDEGLHALVCGELDELGRLEAAEHLAYCDKCMDRYTALLTADSLQPAPRGLHGGVMTSVWARVMQSTAGRAAVAGIAAVLALTVWRSGALTEILAHDTGLQLEPPAAVTETVLPEEDGQQKSFYQKFTDALDSLTGQGENPADPSTGEQTQRPERRKGGLLGFFSGGRDRGSDSASNATPPDDTATQHGGLRNYFKK